jgi:hypothetical protein
MISAGRPLDATGSGERFMLMLVTKTEIAGAMVKMKSRHFGQGAPRPLGVVVFPTRPPGPTKSFWRYRFKPRQRGRIAVGSTSRGTRLTGVTERIGPRLTAA